MILSFRKFNEAIINPQDFTEMIKDFNEQFIKKRMLTIEESNDITSKYGVEFITYDQFLSNLSIEEKKGAPSRHTEIFGYVNGPIINIVLGTHKRGIEMFDIGMIVHMARHESIHVAQVKRKKNEIPVINIKDEKEYYSNKEEVMAFSRSIVDMITMDGRYPIKDKGELLRGLSRCQLWKMISKLVDENIKNRYLKYIYLYMKEDQL